MTTKEFEYAIYKKYFNAYKNISPMKYLFIAKDTMDVQGVIDIRNLAKSEIMINLEGKK